MIKIFLALLIMPLLLFAQPALASLLSGRDYYVQEFRLGDDIVPYPSAYNTPTDCKEGTLYSYLFLNYLDNDYDIEIMYCPDCGWDGDDHVYLEVSDNTGQSFIYDWGMALQGVEGYEGRPITYQKLISEINRHNQYGR